MSSHSKFVTMLWTDLAKVSNLGKEHLRVMELVRLYAISEGVKLSPLDAKQGGRMIEAARETTDGGVSQLEKSVIGRLKDMGYVGEGGISLERSGDKATVHCYRNLSACRFASRIPT